MEYNAVYLLVQEKSTFESGKEGLRVYQYDTTRVFFLLWKKGENGNETAFHRQIKSFI